MLKVKKKKIIRCTQKLLRLIDIPVIDDIEAEDKLVEWYANLLWIERKKCLLFTHENTLFSFLVVDIRASDLRNLENIFQRNFQRALENLAIPTSTIEKLLAQLEGLVICRTKDKHILGSMNDFANQYKLQIENHGGLNNCDINEIIQLVNYSPMTLIKYENGSNLMQKLLISLSR